MFVEEQGLFASDDRDERDEDPSTLHAVSLCGAEVAGTVRLYPLVEPGLWKGDRLAVLPAFRRCRVGCPLVRFAVATAGERGGDRMIAHVQAQNVGFFVRLGWSPVGDLVLTPAATPTNKCKSPSADLALLAGSPHHGRLTVGLGVQ